MAEESDDALLQSLIKQLPNKPGVYRMLNVREEIIYVGKAKDLKKRVSSYFNRSDTSAKTRAMVSHVKRFEITITRTEIEALLLESNLIKALRPKYNVLLRDDKTYPFIMISDPLGFPRLDLLRSKHKPQDGRYFGPYPNAWAAKETLLFLQKTFQIRNCSDSFFKGRSRPCLQYQIGRCSAPCTTYITKEEYQASVQDAVAFLEGRSQQLIETLRQKMREAVERLAFEDAVKIRDKIAILQSMLHKQNVVSGAADVDVFALKRSGGFLVVVLLEVRQGAVVTQKNFHPKARISALSDIMHTADILETFIMQHYLDTPTRIPPTIVLSEAPANKALLEEALRDLAGRICRVLSKPQGEKAKWLALAMENAGLHVKNFDASQSLMAERYQALETFLAMDKAITRMECFDISHTMGEATVASMVVFNNRGPEKMQYRRFNIKTTDSGDDYAAMREALSRRFRAKSIESSGLPQLLIIDGGKGQVAVARDVLQALHIDGVVTLGISKGPERKAGLEQLILADDMVERSLPPDSKALHLLQHIRDEAHRFAITGHRKLRQKARVTSMLEDIPGIGEKRRRVLLQSFGGMQGLLEATTEHIANLTGFDAKLAKRIYEYLHQDRGL